MAIEIIKQGQTKFTAHCYKCGCEFTYEMEDVVGDMVMCPCCGNHIVHGSPTGTITYPYGAIPCAGDHSNTDDQITILPKNCEECDFYKKHLAGGKTYIGDSPCQWCPNYPHKITWYCTTSVIKAK